MPDLSSTSVRVHHDPLWRLRSESTGLLARLLRFSFWAECLSISRGNLWHPDDDNDDGNDDGVERFKWICLQHYIHNIVYITCVSDTGKAVLSQKKQHYWLISACNWYILLRKTPIWRSYSFQLFHPIFTLAVYKTFVRQIWQVHKVVLRWYQCCEWVMHCIQSIRKWTYFGHIWQKIHEAT